MKLKKLKTLEKKIKNWLYNHKWYLNNYERLVYSNKYQNFIVQWEKAYGEAKKENNELNYDFGDMIA